MIRNEYLKSLTVNNRKITSVIIDQHYKESHPELNDEIILELVSELHGKSFPLESAKDEYEYFKVDPVYLKQKPYRLIFLLCFSNTFLGVINAFRVPRKKL